MALRKVINNLKAICSYYYDKKQEKCFYQINVDGKHVFTLEYMENLAYALPYLCKTEGFSGQKCCVEYTNNPQYLKEFVNDL